MRLLTQMVLDFGRWLYFGWAFPHNKSPEAQYEPMTRSVLPTAICFALWVGLGHPPGCGFRHPSNKFSLPSLPTCSDTVLPPLNSPPNLPERRTHPPPHPPLQNRRRTRNIQTKLSKDMPQNGMFHSHVSLYARTGQPARQG